MWGYVFGEERKSGIRRTLKEARGRGGGEKGRGKRESREGLGTLSSKIYLYIPLSTSDLHSYSWMLRRTQGFGEEDGLQRTQWGHEIV